MGTQMYKQFSPEKRYAGCCCLFNKNEFKQGPVLSTQVCDGKMHRLAQTHASNLWYSVALQYSNTSLL